MSAPGRPRTNLTCWYCAHRPPMAPICPACNRRKTADWRDRRAQSHLVKLDRALAAERAAVQLVRAGLTRRCPCGGLLRADVAHRCQYVGMNHAR